MSDPRPDFDPENVQPDPESAYYARKKKLPHLTVEAITLAQNLLRAARAVLATAEPDFDHPCDTFVRTSAINRLSAAVHAIDQSRS